MTLSPQQRTSIREYILEVLETSVADDIGNSQLSAVYDADVAAFLAASARSAVDEAISEFLGRHNDKHTLPLLRLPPELVVECFRYLTFAELIDITHVCCSWRRIALADCRLWNSLTLRRARPCNREIFVTLLARSGNVPFEFTWAPWESSCIANELLDVILQNMGRMGVLGLHQRIPDGTTARLLQHKAPRLRQLITTEYGISVLPADCGPQYLPRLEKLQLDSFVIPADCQPFSELMFFRGMLAKGSSTPVISRIFPRLIELDIQGVTQDTLLVLGPPPSSCRMVWLRNSYFGIVNLDYSAFLQACYQLRIPFLWISGPRSLLPSIHEFVHTTVAQYRIFVCHESMLRLECDADDVVREVWISGVFQVLLQELSCFPHMERLGELVLPLNLLLDMRLMQSRAITPFPGLCSLTIVLPGGTIPSLADLPAGDGLPLRMPRLDALTLEAVACDYGTDDDPNDEASSLNVRWFIAEFPRTLPVLLNTVRPRLATVTVVLVDEFDAAHFAVKQDLSALRSLAETLRIRDQDYEYVREFVDG